MTRTRAHIAIAISTLGGSTLAYADDTKPTVPTTSTPTASSPTTTAPALSKAPEDEERARLNAQLMLEDTRAHVAEAEVERKERYEYHRALHQQKMKALERQRTQQADPDESTAQRLLKRRVFLPRLASLSLPSGGLLGAYGPWDASLVSFTSSDPLSIFRVQPRLHVRLNSNVTVGGSLGFQHLTFHPSESTPDKSTNTSLWFAPQVGYLFPLGNTGLLLWPRASLHGGYSLRKSPGLYGVDANSEPTSYLGGGGELSLLVPIASRAYFEVSSSLLFDKTWVHAEAKDAGFSGNVSIGLGLAF